MQILKVILRVVLLGEFFEVLKLHIFSKFKKIREQSTLEIANTCVLSNQKFLCFRYTHNVPPKVVSTNSGPILRICKKFEKIGSIFYMKLNPNNVKYMFSKSE